MPKFTLREFNQIAPSILNLRGAFVDIYNARKLRTLVEKATKETENLEKDFNALVEKYGEQGEDGRFKVKREFLRVHKAEWDKYLDGGEVVLPNVKIPEKALEYACEPHLHPGSGKMMPPTLTLGDITNLSFLIEDEKKESVGEEPVGGEKAAIHDLTKSTRRAR